MAYQNNLLVPDDGTDLGFKRVTATAEYALGETRWDKTGNKYRYVEFKDSVTYGVGHVCTPANIAWTAVTNDRAGGSSVATGFGGVCMGVPTTTLKYGWVQVGGVATTLGDGSVAAGDFVLVDTVDAQADTFADGEEEQVFGLALEADDATTKLFACLLNGY